MLRAQLPNASHVLFHILQISSANKWCLQKTVPYSGKESFIYCQERFLSTQPACLCLYQLLPYMTYDSWQILEEGKESQYTLCLLPTFPVSSPAQVLSSLRTPSSLFRLTKISMTRFIHLWSSKALENTLVKLFHVNVSARHSQSVACSLLLDHKA